MKCKQMKTASGSCETVTKRSNIHITWALEREKKKRINRKGIQKHNDWKFPKFGKRHEFTDSRIWISKQNKSKEIHVKMYHGQTSENSKDKEKSLVRSRLNYNYNSQEKSWMSEGNGIIFFKW